MLPFNIFLIALLTKDDGSKFSLLNKPIALFPSPYLFKARAPFALTSEFVINNI